jgi:hypothetical protein
LPRRSAPRNDVGIFAGKHLIRAYTSFAVFFAKQKNASLREQTKTQRASESLRPTPIKHEFLSFFAKEKNVTPLRPSKITVTVASYCVFFAKQKNGSLATKQKLADQLQKSLRTTFVIET